MSGLRQKIALGFGGLLVLLLVTGGTSLYLLTRYSGTVDRVFRENYDSVVYGQAMKDALDQIVDGVQLESAIPHAPDQQATARFEDNLRREAGNITVPGEGEAVEALRLRWQAFLTAYRAIASAGVAEQDLRTRHRTSVLAAARAVKEAAQRIIDLNLQSIVSNDGVIRHDAKHAQSLMIAMLGGGVGLAGVCIALFSRALLRPLRTLTSSAREIERGNLDLVVAVPSRDEIGQLAEAFNSMAGRLRETHRSEQQKIIRVERTTQLTLDSLPDAVATITADGAVDLANQAAQRLFRMRPGVRLEVLDSPRLLECWRQVVTTGQPVLPHGYETAIHLVDGEERFFLPHALPIQDRDGQLIGVTLVLADITGLRRLDEMKSNLLAVVSHELKTPLTGLRMATHLLLDEKLGPLTPKQLDLALSARDDASRLHTIVEGLLDISRLESGRALLDLLPIEPRVLVDEAVTAVIAAYRDRGVRLEADLPADLPRTHADRVRMAHVFANLLGNALKYTPRGGQVRITALARPDEIEFRIADTGCGVPPEYRARIFERFYRVPDQGANGAGLGLAIAKEIVSAHGGRLWLAEQETPGATFCFTLPRAPEREI